MYERFYNLRERPFALSPDPEYLYLSRVHGEALDSIRYGIESRAGFIVVTGEIGAGKTTLLQTLLQRLDDRMLVARIVNTMLEPRELIEAIALDFGLPDTAKSKPALLRDLGMFLVQQRAQGRRPLLVIDEAQNLTAQSLEEVRLLSNLETEKSKLLQILLAGQPNLRDTIASPELEQFRQRVAVSYHLMPLDAAETVAYIKFRLEHAAIGEPPRFAPEATDLIYQVTGGVPRLINVVCDATLVFGYAEERHSIDGPLLEEVILELEATGIIPPPEARQAKQREIVAASPDAAIPAAASAVSSGFAERTAPAAAMLNTSPVATPIAAASMRPASASAAAAQIATPGPLDTASAATEGARTAPVPASGMAPVAPPAARAAADVADPTPAAATTRPAEPGASVANPATPPRPAVAPLPPPLAPGARTAAHPIGSRPPAPVPPPVRPTAVFAAAPRAAAPDAVAERLVPSSRDPLPAARELVVARELAAQRELVARRQAELAAREQALIQRERQIAEQRRIMGEEYRLLRNAQPGRPLTPGGAGAPRAAASMRGSAATIASSAGVQSTTRQRTWAAIIPMWQRILRIFTGAHALRS
jgi:putative secretion ATPase (PEP-CTERM system associated)